MTDCASQHTEVLVSAQDEDGMVEPQLPPDTLPRNTSSDSSISGQKRTRSNSADESLQVDRRNDPTDQSHEEAWKGWAELENDPLVFTQLLRDWGVPDVTVDEVIPLDAIYEKPSNSVLGLIFLSRWTAPEVNDNAVDTPQNLWFANQISTYSCATLALMNIINNSIDLDLGVQLNEFKRATTTLSPKERGVSLDNFGFIKDIHNSFARHLDHMIVDLKLKEDVQAAKKKRSQNKKKKRRATRKKKVYDDDDDENGFHFIAYVPSGDAVWKLDGMESLPRRLGNIDAGIDWLSFATSDIQQQLEDAEANAMEFSLLSLTRQPGAQLEQAEMSDVLRKKEDWSPFIAHMLRLHAERGDIEALLE